MTSSAELRQALDEATTARNEVLEEARTKAGEIVSQLVEAMPGIWKRMVEDARDQEPDKALALGPEGVAAVKATLNDLTANSEEIVRQHVGVDNPEWLHNVEPPERIEYSWSGMPSWPVEGWRAVLGAVGRIYADHDLLPEHSAESWSRQGWQRFPFHTDGLLPDDIAELLCQYREIGERLGQAHKKVGDLAAQTKRAQAQELWDED